MDTRPHVVTDNELIRHKISKGEFSNTPYSIDWKAFEEAVRRIYKLKEESNEADRRLPRSR